MRLGVIGVGHVGLVTGVCFAELGHEVIAADKDARKIKLLSDGIATVYEPGVEELLQKALSANHLRFTTDPQEVVDDAEIIFICVGTPPRADGSADLSQVEEAARTVAEVLSSYRLLVEKSTVPVKTAQWIERTIRLYSKDGVEFDVASNPEFLREGRAVQDFMHPDRIVIGANSDRAKSLLLALYEGFDCPKIVTDVNTAELIKHASNSFLALKISFINMIADLCERAGTDIEVIAEGMGLDHRIGRAFLDAGIGYGGSCLPKDVKAFIKIAEEFNLDFSLLRAVDAINQHRIDVFMNKVRSALWIIKGKVIGILGLSFKPNTDDIREAPSIKVIERLLHEGAHMKLYDPRAMSNMKALFPPSEQIEYANDAYEAVRDAHALLVLTEWDEFAQLDLKRVRELMATPIIVDGRNVFDPKRVRAQGFEYYCIGRATSS